ncbi:MAG TPA: winged helix-turn-helix transcriptional regulator [Candidatus Thermoplasmatota archaeon]|nr:winged helix-turn-helix transcriptional regulator [Candidatus Thermoplasmatota archaeon]
MEPEHALLLESRKRIFEHVRARPGLHLRAIARDLGLPLGTALYHLDCLVGVELVAVRRDGRYKRFFTRHDLGRREKDYIAVLHHAVPRRVLAVLLRRGKRTQRELAQEVGVSRSTLSFHVTSLVRQGILRCEERWPENLYSPLEPELVARVIREQRLVFQDEMVDLYAASLEPAPTPGEAVAVP